ncbi:DUF2975 domain-containing protein [Algoriphagus taiwanensis]|uniref:DUF2975 domain-containing protein n=1 Tax=Algoriphagus taiwanensis TaxID=1445656 RepID=A0ABQ6Q5E4_9BACT|nr:hypothetical protein Ataiwa_30680 [Algoriphagus taiwanensis]
MKITRILLWITYISLGLSAIAFGLFGIILIKTDFQAQKIENGDLAGVTSKSTTGKFKLPMNLEAEYYLRVKDGQVLVDGYFLKIQKKYIPDSFLANVEIPETDYPVPIQGDFYSMPESDSYLYIKTDFSSIESALHIWKFYFILSFGLLVGAIVLVILFLKNCDNGNFFIAQNAALLRVISYLAIGYSLMEYGFQWLVFNEMNSQLEESFSFSLNSNLDFNWNYLIISIFLVLIAQAFTEGTKLKEEQSLTI